MTTNNTSISNSRKIEPDKATAGTPDPMIEIPDHKL